MLGFAPEVIARWGCGCR